MINDYILCVYVGEWGSAQANKVYELKSSSRLVTFDENCSMYLMPTHQRTFRQKKATLI